MYALHLLLIWCYVFGLTALHSLPVPHTTLYRSTFFDTPPAFHRLPTPLFTAFPIPVSLFMLPFDAVVPPPVPFAFYLPVCYHSVTMGLITTAPVYYLHILYHFLPCTLLLPPALPCLFALPCHLATAAFTATTQYTLFCPISTHTIMHLFTLQIVLIT